MLTRPHPWFQPLRWLLSLALLGLVARLLWLQGAEWLARGVAFDGGRLGVASVGLALYFVLGCALWRGWVLALGHPLSFRAAFRTLYLSNLAKYLPGGAWNYLDRTLRLGRYGVPAIAGTLATVIDVVCAIAAAQLVAAIALFGSPLPGGGLVLAASVLVVLVGLHPRSLNRGLSLAGRMLRREIPAVPYSYRFLLLMMVGYIASWILLGASVAVFAQALVPEAPGIVVGGAFALSWAVGTVAFIFPAGLGVREATLVALLSPVLTAATPALLALALRLWFLVADVVLFALASLFPESPSPLPGGGEDGVSAGNTRRGGL